MDITRVVDIVNTNVIDSWPSIYLSPRSNYHQRCRRHQRWSQASSLSSLQPQPSRRIIIDVAYIATNCLLVIVVIISCVIFVVTCAVIVTIAVAHFRHYNSLSYSHVPNIIVVFSSSSRGYTSYFDRSWTTVCFISFSNLLTLQWLEIIQYSLTSS